MQRVTGEGVKPHEIRQLRRDIARIKTILRERELGAPAGPAGPAAKEQTGAKS